MKQFFAVISLLLLISISAQTTLTRDINYVDSPAIVVFPDNSYLLHGNAPDGFYAIEKRFADGTLDSSYGNNGVALIPASYAAEQGEEGNGHYTQFVVLDENFLVAHREMTSWNVGIAYVKRYHFDGTLDTTFGVNGTLDNLQLNPYNINSLINLGDSSFVEIRYDKLIKYNIDGQIDTSFGNNGEILYEFGDDLSVFAVRGNYIYANRYDRYFIRFDYTNPAGTFQSSDETLTYNTRIMDYGVNDNNDVILIQKDDTYYSFVELPTTHYFNIVEMSTGQINTTFNGDGYMAFHNNNNEDHQHISVAQVLGNYYVAIVEHDSDSYILSYDENGFPLTINNEFRFGLNEFPVGTKFYEIQKYDNNSVIITTSLGNFKFDVGTGGINPCPTTTTWDGLSWDNGTPDATKNVFIKGILPETTSDTEVCRLKIIFGGKMVIGAGNSLTVNRELVTSHNSLTIEDGGSLFELDETILNNAYITIKKSSQPMKRLDYTLWSSPTNRTHVLGFSPNTLHNRIYIYDGSGYYNVNTSSNPRNFMSIATGYLYRAPNDWNATNPEPFLGIFSGVPHNGNITRSVYADPDFPEESTPYTSIGNPYPSNINADLLLAENPGIKALYFWNNTGVAGSNYATYTAMGGTAAAGGSNVPDGKIAVAQGFLVHSTQNTVVFKNSMRTAEDAIFFKGNQNDKHRFWLNLNNKENENLSQTLVGYMNGATNEIDNQIDGKMFGNEGSALYSIISEEKFSIQGRALPFEKSDVVKLGFKAVEAGKFTISLSNFDGLFAEGEVKIYLKDNELNTTHDLMDSDYSFETIAGEFKTRFEVVYETEEVMGTEDLTANSVQIYTQNANIIVNSKSEKILSVELFDLNGRKIHSKNEINANNYQIKSNSIGVLVVKVQTQNGKIINQKIIMK